MYIDGVTNEQKKKQQMNTWKNMEMETTNFFPYVKAALPKLSHSVGCSESQDSKSPQMTQNAGF